MIKPVNGLRRLRERKMLTQADLAKAVGISRQGTISKWETSEDRPRVAHMRQLCEVLGVTPDELLSALDQHEGEE